MMDTEPVSGSTGRATVGRRGKKRPNIIERSAGGASARTSPPQASGGRSSSSVGRGPSALSTALGGSDLPKEAPGAHWPGTTMPKARYQRANTANALRFSA